MTSCDDVDIAMYSASAVESATEVCNLLLQAMVDPHIIAIYHVLDLRASPFPKKKRIQNSFDL